MKRFLLILFVLLLPLESVWTVASAFCAHEQDAGAQQHLGHHEDLHAHAADSPNDSTPEPTASEGHCGACHFGHCCFVVASFVFQPTASLPAYAIGLAGAPPVRPNPRPERPKWPARQPALA